MWRCFVFTRYHNTHSQQNSTQKLFQVMLVFKMKFHSSWCGFTMACSTQSRCVHCKSQTVDHQNEFFHFYSHFQAVGLRYTPRLCKELKKMVTRTDLSQFPSIVEGHFNFRENLQQATLLLLSLDLVLVFFSNHMLLRLFLGSWVTVHLGCWIWGSSEGWFEPLTNIPHEQFDLLNSLKCKLYIHAYYRFTKLSSCGKHRSVPYCFHPHSFFSVLHWDLATVTIAIERDGLYNN